ncbi:inhibitor of lysozyme (Ivy) [Ciceribacter lividus]|uniref:Inhibitor of lysozyme (Ivy) n=1 Tax=Ciceribacter lividus TaxID=1197950 RepID=A0A6I7HI72_9HYPH|nr:Ivy family c-type lysozyme inhibitor [Ciceribacter lividus]RCW21519.1 inhibitor of lysozyme (Ivy) [Ciceribacter lividus]
MAAAVAFALAFPLHAEEPAQSLSGNFLPQVIAMSAPHREALETLLRGRRGLPYWIRSMVVRPKYIALASKSVAVDGKEMQLFSACEAGRCAESRLRALFSADGKRVTVYIHDARQGHLVFGDPTPAERLAGDF